MSVARESSAVFTIGHGNRPLGELIALLQRWGIVRLLDVRAHPGSRRHPHFGRMELQTSLPIAGIRYEWQGIALGGRRRARGDSPHTAIRNESFRAYADHMETDEFRAAVEELSGGGAGYRIALMCAERLPWQCHRFMISDYLVAHGVAVRHIIDTAEPRAHRLREEARVIEGRLVYDVHTQRDLELD